MREVAKSGIEAHLQAPFSSIVELARAMDGAGCKCGVTQEVVKTPYMYMLVCPKNETLRCGARILGAYSPADGAFHIRRCETAHSCDAKDAVAAAVQELRNPRYARMRVGEIVEIFAYKMLGMGYFEVYSLVQAMGRLEDKENAGNARRVDARDESLFPACLKHFEGEFSSLNPGVVAEAGEREFFFRQPEYSKHLRNIVELRVYERPTGFLVVGFLYDPGDEPVVQSMLLTESPKAASVRSFLVRNSLSFYIIDLDIEIIDVLKAAKVEFFIKTRSVCAYLEESGEDDSSAPQHFYDCNYGDRVYLDLDPRYYLRKYCSVGLFNLNNMPVADPDYITNSLLGLPFFDCLNGLLWLISDDLRCRISIARESVDNKLPESVTELMEDLGHHRPQRDIDFEIKQCRAQVPDVCACPCGKFQEYLVPCVHAVRKMQSLGIDPYLYVSTIYSRDNITKLPPITPVVNVRAGLRSASSKQQRPDQSSSDSNSVDLLDV